MHLRMIIQLFPTLLLTLSALGVFGQDSSGGVQRKGFVIGFGAGGGVISISDSDAEVPFDRSASGISFPNLKIGFMLNDDLALLATFPGMIYEYEGKDRSFDAFIPSLQYWFQDRWWVNGGIGLAMDMPAFYEIEEGENETFNFGCAVAVGAGYELVQKGNYTLDLQTRLHLGRVLLEDDRHRDGVVFSVGVGFNWY